MEGAVDGKTNVVLPYPWRIHSATVYIPDHGVAIIRMKDRLANFNFIHPEMIGDALASETMLPLSMDEGMVREADSDQELDSNAMTGYPAEYLVAINVIEYSVVEDK